MTLWLRSYFKELSGSSDNSDLTNPTRSCAIRPMTLDDQGLLVSLHQEVGAKAPIVARARRNGRATARNLSYDMTCSNDSFKVEPENTDEGIDDIHEDEESNRLC